MNLKKRRWGFAAVLLAALLLSGCGGGMSSAAGSRGSAEAEAGESSSGGGIVPVGEEYVTEIEVSYNSDNVRQAVQYIFAMDTEMMLQAFGENAEAAVKAAGEEILRLDQLLSVGIEGSDIARLNAEGSAEVDPITAELISQGIGIGENTEGAFDVTVYPLMEAWGFTTGEYRVPGQEEIDELLSRMGKDRVRLEENRVTLFDGTRIDLGGIAKGYTSGRLMEIFADFGVQAALVSLGGNVQSYGLKTNGSDWNVAIQNPDKSGDYLGILRCHDLAVITSGGYERHFEEDGVDYHHILDPSNGYPANAGARSVTVVSRDGTLADALSTALFVMGPEKAVSFWRESGENFGFIILKEDGSLLVTEDLAGSFTTELAFEMVGRQG